MIKLFIFSNSFNTHILVKSLKYLFNNTISKIIILQENNDKELEMYDYHIVFCNNPKNAVELSDYVIVWNDEGIPPESVKLIENLCAIHKKPYTNIPICSNQYSSFREIEKIITSLHNCPILLNISVGLGTLQPYIELLLNNIISSINVDFKQYYSPITQTIIDNLNGTKLLSIKEYKSCLTNFNTADFSILSLSVQNIGELYEYTNIFHEICPDFIIVQTSLGYMSFSDLSNFLNTTCLIKCNILIESNYRVINNEWVVNCGKRDSRKNYTLDADSKDLGNDLLKRIVSHFSLPKGIKRF